MLPSSLWLQDLHMDNLMETKLLLLSVLLCFSSAVLGETDPDDMAILDEFRKGLDNADLLQWPSDNQDPCGQPNWKYVFCNGARVTQIQAKDLGLSGPLPQNFNKLTELTNLGLQRNNFNGKLPSFSGLSKLQYAYLGWNQFDTIPSDFFSGLSSLQVLSLDYNPLNKSSGWQIPPELEKSGQLMNVSLMNCNLIGPIPEFLGRMASLAHLKLSYNDLSGEIPASFSKSSVQTLWLNNQNNSGLTGSLDILASMTMLTDVLLHGNSFTGPIPSAIGACTSLKTLSLNGNQLVGLIPSSLTSLPQLQSLKVDNNKLMGSIPEVKFNFTYASNSFCQTTPGVPCAPEVTALLNFLSSVNYPLMLASQWSGNDPCGSWLGVSCLNGKVSVINLPNRKLNGTINPSVADLEDLVTIRLDKNNLNGKIPVNLTSLKLLKTLDVSDNNLMPPPPPFGSGVSVLTDGNPLFKSSGSPSPPGSSLPIENPPPPSSIPSTGPPPSSVPSTGPPPSSIPSTGTGGSDINRGTHSKGSKTSKLVIVVPVVIGVLILSLVVLFVCFRVKKKKSVVAAPSSIVIYPRDPSDPGDILKIAVANNAGNSTTQSDIRSSNISGQSEAHVIESGNIVISVQILRSVTHNFSPENELGRGGFGVVYKGELHDGTIIAVKRMQAAVFSNKALDEFQAEIAVLTKVRHRNLVNMLGYSVEGNERLLVYEYMPQGALSKHLFHWKDLNMEPLSWKMRLNVALDVARAMEYLHSLAHQSFIHRDLKSSNILLDDCFRAKVSDFGLVKLAPDGKHSIATRLAGTFGYLAPEYAVTGKITTKADVFSFGVVLMELITGLVALDENRPDESRHLASWFCQIKSSKENLMAAVDPALDLTEEVFESISTIAELAWHCTAREPHQRPDMGHAVNVLAPLVEKWKPMENDQEDYLGIDLGQPLVQLVNRWKAADSTDVSTTSLDDSKGSIPARPIGFAESFTSADGR